MKKPSVRRIAVVLVLLVVVMASLGYYYIVSGGMSARQTPTALETFLGRRLVELSVPNKAKVLKNPLSASADGADAAAGRILFQSHCEVCHGYDGAGKTAAANGMYPPPLSLRRPDLAKRGRTDGELFYFVRNGIRNTAMPGWQLTDEQTWQLVTYIRNLPQTVAVPSEVGEIKSDNSSVAARYVGSTACQKCHTDIYNRWKKTLMANVVRDPREHPDAIIPDFSKA